MCFYGLHGLLNLHFASGKENNTCAKIISAHQFTNTYKHIWLELLFARTILQIRTSTSGWNNSRDQNLEFDWQHMVLWLRTIAKILLPPIKSQQKQYSFNLKQHARNVVVLKIIQSRRQLQFRNLEGILKVQSTGKLHCFLLNLQ